MYARAHTHLLVGDFGRGTTLEEDIDNRRLTRACSQVQGRLEAAGTVTKVSKETYECQKRPSMYIHGKLRGQ